ncbi:MAG: hypothetical protein JNN17_12010 [Verrucomicrobiaceae bacterium]|nr:hypothetical protein [Verrucomicrobiaceae bacterium]
MKARIGKIARLPKAIREQLNQRLADGEPSETLLRWLHTLPEVLEVLVREFEGRPILKQNLSEWRQGGFREWEARQERLAQLRLLTEEADNLEAASPQLPDRMAALLAGRFASLIATTMQVKDWSKPRHRAQLMELNEAVATLRRFDQSAARLKLECEQLEIKKAELHLAQEAQTKRTHAQWREWTQAFMRALRAQDAINPEQALREFLTLLYGHADEELIKADRIKYHAKAGIPITPDDATLLERTEAWLKMAPSAKTASASTEGGDSTKNPPAASKESQTQSNLVKPTSAPTDLPGAAGLSSADEDLTEEQPVEPPEEEAENEEVSRVARDDPEPHENDLGDDWLEPDALPMEDIMVLPEPPGRTTLGRLC